MKNFLSIILLLIAFSTAKAQTYYLQAKVEGFPGTRAYLMQFKADQQSVIDSASSLDGVFAFRFGSKTKPGVYRVLLGNEGGSNFFEKDPLFFDFIYNYENIEIHTNFNAPLDSMKVIQSKENDVYYRFLKANEIYQSKLNLITPLFFQYKAEDSFYQALSSEFYGVQSTFLLFCTALTNELPESIAASVIQMSTLPVVEKPGKEDEMKVFIREHYFDLVSFGDERLINSPFITKSVLDYLGIYRDTKLDQSQQEDQFILAIDKIMDVVQGNPAVYDFTLNLLVDGFQRFQMEKVLVHIAENYVTGGCETNSKKLLQKRLEGYEKMAPGKKVPDILMLDQNGKQVRLYDLDHDYTLVLFWASWCPHCTSFLKQLSKWYPEKALDIEVFAVSIDSSKFAWEEGMMMGNFPWINTFSGAGWDGKAPKDFNVYATPTLFLLNSDHVIIAKPLTFKEFKKEVDVLSAKAQGR
jgi:thiol-disulfide isomerase/thioredoxin